MNGVSKKMLGTLIKLNGNQLVKLGIAIRATGTATGLANLAVTVVRDEAGNLMFADETGVLPGKSNWLARKAGFIHATPERQVEGGNILMREIFDAIIDKRLIATDSTDSEPRETP